jgi:hypothetical protein
MTRWLCVTAATALLAAVAGPCAAADKDVTARNPWPDAYAGDKGTSRVRFDARLGDTAPMTEAELVPALLNAIDQLSKYPRAVSVPEIRRIPHDDLARMVCGAPCPARATYRPGEGIYLDDTLKPETNLFDRSVLLHELVHFVQEMEDEHGDMRPCMRWYYREQEAYAIQKTFLVMIGSPVRVAYSAQRDACDGEPTTRNAAPPR